MNPKERKEAEQAYQACFKPSRVYLVSTLAALFLCLFLSFAFSMVQQWAGAVIFTLLTILDVSLIWFLSRRYKRKMKEYEAELAQFLAELDTLSEEEWNRPPTSEEEAEQRKIKRAAIWISAIGIVVSVVSVALFIWSIVRDL